MVLDIITHWALVWLVVACIVLFAVAAKMDRTHDEDYSDDLAASSPQAYINFVAVPYDQDEFASRN